VTFSIPVHCTVEIAVPNEQYRGRIKISPAGLSERLFFFEFGHPFNRNKGNIQIYADKEKLSPIFIADDDEDDVAITNAITVGAMKDPELCIGAALVLICPIVECLVYATRDFNEQVKENVERPDVEYSYKWDWTPEYEHDTGQIAWNFLTTTA
jgi:hypothetical protein